MSAEAAFWIVQMLNALQLSMLLFLLSIGLTVIFGLMHFVNLAHGALYALGAFMGVTARGAASAPTGRRSCWRRSPSPRSGSCCMSA